MYLTRRPAAAAAAVSARPTHSAAASLRGLRLACGGSAAAAIAAAAAFIPSAAAAARCFSRHAALQTVRPQPTATASTAAPHSRAPLPQSQPLPPASAQHSPPDGPNGAGSAPPSAASLIQQLQSLRQRKAPSHEVEALADLVPDSAWSIVARAYFEYYNDFPGSDLALRRFDRATSRGIVPAALAYHMLFRCFARDWKPEHAAVMDRLRAEMLAQSPPLRFTAAFISRMHQRGLEQPAMASRLLRWAEEDGVWNTLNPPAQERIARSAAQDLTARAAGDAASSTTSAAADRVIHRLNSLRSKKSLQPAEIESTFKSLSAADWCWPVLHAYLCCYAQVPGARLALRTFQRVSRQLRGTTPPKIVGAVCICLAKEWSAEYLPVLDTLRARMRSHKPPLRFDSLSLETMVPALLGHKETASRLQRWTAEDGSWEELGSEVQQQITVAAAAAPVASSARHSAASATAASAAAPAAHASATPAPSYVLLQQLTQVLESENPFSSDDIESAVTGIVSRAWTLDALHAYLRCYTEVAGAAAALRTFELVTGELGRVPNVDTFSLLLQCMARDWRPQRAATMDSLRARMLAQTPALRFGASHIATMLSLFATQAETASRLHQWAQDDGAWTQLVPKMQRRIMAAINVPSSSSTGAAVAQPPQQQQQTDTQQPAAVPDVVVASGSERPPSSSSAASPASPAGSAKRKAAPVSTRAARMAHLLHGEGGASVAPVSDPAVVAASATAAAPSAPHVDVISNCDFARQLRNASSKGADAVEALVAQHQGEKWSTEALREYLRLCTHVPDARAALRVFDRATTATGRQGTQADVYMYSQLFRALHADWRAENADTIVSLRQRMRASDPPVHFGPSHIRDMSMAFRSEGLAQLRQWAEEDGAWEALSDGLRQFLSSPMGGSAGRLFDSLNELSRSSSTTAADLVSAVEPFDDADWTIHSLRTCLRCCERVRAADAAMSAFRKTTAADPNAKPTAAVYCQLLRCLARDWRPEHAATMDDLRAEMQAQQPPLRFGDIQILGAVPAFLKRREMAERLLRWAREDGVWDKLDSKVQQRVRAAAEAPKVSTTTLPLLSQSTLRRRLTELAEAGEFAEAERLVAEAEKAGTKLDVKTASAWLGCYERSGEWRGAEAVWQRMAELGITPDSASYRKLIQIHMADGSAAQLAKAEALFTEMTNGSGPAGAPLQFSVRDFEKLIRAATSQRLPAEARKWAERAKAAGLWDQLDGWCRSTLPPVAERKEVQPRVPQQKEKAAQAELVDVAAPAEEGQDPARLTAAQQRQSMLQRRMQELVGTDEVVAAAEPAAAVVEPAATESAAGGAQLTAQAASERLAFYARHGKWRGAEKLWQRMAELGLAPDAAAYCALMEAYLASGRADQLAKIEPLYAEMTSGSGRAGTPLQLSVSDFERLIQATHRHGLGGQVRHWSERAKAAGVWEHLNARCHSLGTPADANLDPEHSPRPTSSGAAAAAAAPGAAEPSSAGEAVPDEAASQRLDESLSRWDSQTAEARGDPASTPTVASLIHELHQAGRDSDARRVLDEYFQLVEGHLTPESLHARLAELESHAHEVWALDHARLLWQLAQDRSVAPGASSYRVLMQLCLARGGPADLEWCERLFAASQEGPLSGRLSPEDCIALAQAARKARRPAVYLKFMERAARAQVHVPPERVEPQSHPEPVAEAAVDNDAASTKGEASPIIAASSSLASSVLSSELSTAAGSMSSWRPSQAEYNRDVEYVAQQMDEWWNAKPAPAHTTTPKPPAAAAAAVDLDHSQTENSAAAADATVAPAEFAPLSAPAESTPNGQHATDATVAGNQSEQPTAGVTPPATDNSAESTAAAATTSPSTQPAAKSRSKKKKNAESESDAQQLPAASESTSTIPPDSAAPAAVPSSASTSAADAPLSAAALSALTVVQLRALLKERGLKVSGVKSELVDRLVNAPAGEKL